MHRIRSIVTNGFYRIAAAVPKVRVADVNMNVEEMKRMWRKAHDAKAALVLFPELSITAYSCGDLFTQKRLLDGATAGLEALLACSQTTDCVGVVGMPVLQDGRLFNCAVVLQRGKIVGVVPKTFVPEHKEYYEKRWFTEASRAARDEVVLVGESVPFGTDLLFEGDENLLFGIEICEDLWSVTPPSLRQAAAGATLLLNLSASDEIVGKSDYRASLVSSQSARCMAAYAYASCGMGESTTDVVFGGDAMIAENGVILSRNERFIDESRIIFADVDLQRLRHLRLSEGSFVDEKPDSFRRIMLQELPQPMDLRRDVDPHPFVPSDDRVRSARCEEIFTIQAAGLQKRLSHIGCETCVIGISGGLDSTLALLAVRRTYERMGLPFEKIVAVTMPGFGTTGRTLENARRLCRGLGVSLEEIDITEACQIHFQDIGHDPKKHDVVYENTQARERTQILMDLANERGGIVVGTGDLSEAALGWSTYNGDHMSMYAINIGIPKTLVRYLVAWAAQEYEEVRDVLQDILDTPVSPELLPPSNGEIVQKTEETVGPYELHDFFLYHFIRGGADPQKILFLAEHAFEGVYETAQIKQWLRTFLRRFFTQQFKRSCMPDGPKVGTVALSPRGDWRMPSDAVAKLWLEFER